MKSAYQLAMERLDKTSPTVKLTAGQKRQIAELESRCKAKIAELEIHLSEQIGAASAQGNAEKVAELEQRLAHERRKLHADLEAKKEAARRSKT